MTGANGVCTRSLLGYAPCGSASSGDQTYLLQAVPVLHSGKEAENNAKGHFWEDLLSVIDVWLGRKDRVVLMMDVNKHVLERKLPKALEASGLWPAVHSHNGGIVPNTHFC